MQGEVTAAKRPKNSALEVDLDFEHNVKPARVITEEVTASLEELIQKRILEGRFDDVQKPPALLNKTPREKKELDENKSKKGLAELYEDEYAQKTGLVSNALTFSDEQKKEIGREREVAVCLMQKCIDRGPELQIRAAIALDHLKNYIFIEADKEAHVRELACGWASLDWVFSTAKNDVVCVRFHLAPKTTSFVVQDGTTSSAARGGLHGTV